jgi:3-oxoacyl-[acyl-carrier protein] reductase
VKLDSKTAIITGAGSGIGKAIALKFSDNGANIVVADVDLKAAQKTVYDIKNAGRNALAVETDVSNKDQVVELKERCLKQFGTIDILVNNAGVMSPPTPMEDLPEEYWDRLVKINMKGTFLCSQIVGKEMIKVKRGCIVNIASMCGHGPYPKCGAYGATKAAILLLTQQLALEWAAYNIRVNSISPGTIVTPLNEKVYADRKIYEQRSAIIPLHRPGYPQDIANTALFLASDDSSYITGTDILVDGGLMKISQQMLPGRAGDK